MDVVMPQLGETVTEGTIAAWYKQVGDRVGPDEPLFEVETDKVAMDIPAPAAGVLAQILVPVGERVEVGARLAVIRIAGEAAEAVLTTVVHFGGEGCCRGLGTMRRLSKFQYFPRCEITGRSSQASRISRASLKRSRFSSAAMPIWISSCGTPLAQPISSRPPVRLSSMPISSSTRHGW